MLASLLAVVVPVLGATLQASIDRLQEADYRTTKFVLRDTETYSRERAPVAVDGSVEFYNLKTDRKYLLTLDSDSIEIEWDYLIKPAETDEEFTIHKVRAGQPLDMLGPSIDHPIKISSYHRSELVTERPEFSIFKFFLQGSVIMSIGALAVVTYLPKWLQMLDPETIAELQQNQIGGKKPVEAKK